MESRLSPEREWRPGSALRRRRTAILCYVVLALVVAFAGARDVLHDVESRAEAGRVALDVHASVPFGGGPGGWSGRLEIHNGGSRPVSVLALDLARPAVLLKVYGVPQRIAVRATAAVTVRLRLDCSARPAVGQLTTPGLTVRLRTADGRELSERVAFGDSTALVSQLQREQCGPPAGPTAQRVRLAYAGSRVTHGVIESTVILRNDNPGLVRVLDVTGASGWPTSVRAGPSTLLATIPAGDAIPLTLQWDVAACPPIEADEVISSLRMVLITPDDELELGAVDLGPAFARDFFEHFRSQCR